MAIDDTPETKASGGVNPRPRPLTGLRILDLTNVLAGPYCCYQLAMMGAEVIKVERPSSGDLARQLGADPDRNRNGMGISFLAQNAGKRSVTLDMKHPEGKALLKRLVKTADVVVENFRPGVMDRLGLGYDVLREVNPTLIYCAISGFGQGGPWKDNPAYDQIVQGISGLMSITGDDDSAPLRVGYPLADTMGGMTAAFAIAAELNKSPRGGMIDVSMTESVICSMGWVVSNYLTGGVVPAANGNENMTSAPSGTFATADQPINIAANRDTQWRSLARHLGREDLLDNPDYLTREDRKAHRHALRAELETVLTTRPAADWARELNALGVPTGEVMTVPQVLATEQIEGRRLVGTLENDGAPLQVLGSPVIVDGVRPAPDLAPPRLGADNVAVWGELGLSAAEVADLESEGVI
ncbi:MAG: CoA transferase [Rhodobacteraceae bacterium]|nr:CoA transferase [Paracoccaceae bacterium]